MLKLSEYCVFAGIIAVILALVCYVLAFASVRVARARTTLATEPPDGGTATLDAPAPNRLVVFGTLTTWLALGFLSAALVFRWFGTGHGPFANMYEFSVAFAWGALVVHVYFLQRYRQWAIGVIVLPVALAMLLYATTIPEHGRAARPGASEQPAADRSRGDRGHRLRRLRGRLRGRAPLRGPGRRPAMVPAEARAAGRPLLPGDR